MSSDTAIRFRNVGKCYRVGAAQSGSNFRYKSLGERMGQFARHPLRSIGGGGAVNDDEFWALRDVSFDVPRGEVVGVIGRNGAGKSTLLKILSQITKPTEGEIEVHGRVGSLLEVGTGFHPELTGRENVFLNGSILGMTRREVKRKFDEIVAFSEVERFLETPVKQYSSGMYTRLAFAVAAHLDPEILVVDEVLAVGDAEFQKKCLGKMQDVSKGGRTVLFVSHNMAAVRKLCTRAVWLSGGEVHDQGMTDAVCSAYVDNALSMEAGSELWELQTDLLRPVSIQFNINDLGSSDELVIDLVVESKKEIERCGVSVDIKTNDCIVSRLMPGVTGAQFTLQPGITEVQIKLPGITTLLTTYTYDIAVGLHETNVKALAVLDPAVRMSFTSRNAYGKARDVNGSAHGLVQLPITATATLKS